MPHPAISGFGNDSGPMVIQPVSDIPDTVYPKKGNSANKAASGGRTLESRKIEQA
jgi:hypothetical protein